jgi:hypothetical protein
VRVLVGAAVRKLVQVGLPDDDRARFPQPLHDQRVFPRHVVAVELRPVRRAQPFHGRHVLDSDRQPVQQPRVLTAAQLERARVVQRALRNGDDRVDLPV